MNTMNYVVPWKDTLAVNNLKDIVDLEALRDELFNLSLMTDNEDETQEFVNADLFPEIIRTRDNIITPMVTQYALDIFEYAIPEIIVETNAKWIKEGEGLFPHFHPGSCLSAIFYPGDSDSGLNIFDPRGNACRGYPKPIRNRFMSAYRLSPKAGDLVILPSYLQHSVSYVKEEVRLSLLHEYYLRSDL